MLIQLSRIVVDNTALSVTIDHQNNIHLLDLDEEGRKTLTNAIDAGFQLKVLEQVKEQVSKWYLYHTDGYVTKWDGHFHHVPHTEPVLYKPFTTIAKERQESN